MRAKQSREPRDTMTSSTPQPGSGPRILLYSDDVDVRAEVRLAVGPRLGAGRPQIEWIEVGTADAVLAVAKADGADLLVLDGEADKVGGMGLARQLKDEVFECPPVLLLIARPADSWLAHWSNAEGVVCRPLDPIAVHDAVAGLLVGEALAR
jgi:DNA-binding response OmpR family regulator